MSDIVWKKYATGFRPPWLRLSVKDGGRAAQVTQRVWQICAVRTLWMHGINDWGKTIFNLYKQLLLGSLIRGENQRTQTQGWKGRSGRWRALMAETPTYYPFCSTGLISIYAVPLPAASREIKYGVEAAAR